MSASTKLTLNKAPGTSVMTYGCPHWKFPTAIKAPRGRKRRSALLASFQGAHGTARCMWLSKFGTRVLITKLYRQKALVYEIMTMKMFATLDKAKPNIGNIRD